MSGSVDAYGVQTLSCLVPLKYPGGARMSPVPKNTTSARPMLSLGSRLSVNRRNTYVPQPEQSLVGRR